MMSYFKLLTALFLLISTLTLIHCDDPPPLSELEKLPPKTQEGKGRFGCLVNGKAWVVENSYYTGAIYQKDIFQIHSEIMEPNKNQGINFILYPEVLEEGKYPLANNPDSFSEFIMLSPIKCIYERDYTLSGELVLTKVDINNRIVSGEFEFTTVMEDCDTIKVTDGRFDLRLGL